MKNRNTLKGFTLIELLVVITIIGILATGATTVYTSQIQKARDTTRITDITAVKSGIEQAYQDTSEYPELWGPTGESNNDFVSRVTQYVPKLPSDPKSTNISTNSVFDYFYNRNKDSNGIAGQLFEISTHFEQSGNIITKAAKDNWNDNFRLELGVGIDSINTKITSIAKLDSDKKTGVCYDDSGTVKACSDNSGNPMLIRGNPVTTTDTSSSESN